MLYFMLCYILHLYLCFQVIWLEKHRYYFYYCLKVYVLHILPTLYKFLKYWINYAKTLKSFCVYPTVFLQEQGPLLCVAWREAHKGVGGPGSSRASFWREPNWHFLIFIWPNLHRNNGLLRDANICFARGVQFLGPVLPWL